MEKFLTPKMLSKRWHTTTAVLANKRHKKQGVKFVKIGRKVLYKLKDIEKAESSVKR